jgi:uncharacterized membrane protein
MKFSYSAVWNDAVALMRSHGALLLAVAGVFIFLPLLLTSYLLPAATSTTDPLGALGTYYRENWPWLTLGSVVNSIGAIAIYRLVFGNRLSVGQAIAGAMPLLPFYFIMTVILSLAIGFGLALFIVPGIYLIGRLSTAAPAMVAENRRNPLDALGESWRLTSRRGWAVVGLIILVAVAGFILTFVVTTVLGSIFVLVGGREGVGGLLVLILGSAVNAVFYTVLIVLIAAIYRALRSPGEVDLTKGI